MNHMMRNRLRIAERVMGLVKRLRSQICNTERRNPLIGRQQPLGIFAHIKEAQQRRGGNSATMKAEITFSILFLVGIIVTDYLHSTQRIPISSAVPTQIFQLLVMANQMAREQTGEGILKKIWRKITGFFRTDN